MVNRQKLYDELYGEIPEDFEGRVKHILNTRNAESIAKKASVIQKRVKRIKRIKTKFIFYTETRPSARPRITSVGGFSRFYVPRAQMNKRNFEIFYNEHGNLPHITTPMSYDVDIYIKTPTSFTKVETLLAEFGVIKPWGRTGDIDNNLKTILDMSTGTLISDDCLVDESHTRCFYSIKPRVEFEITYMEKFPDFKI